MMTDAQFEALNRKQSQTLELLNMVLAQCNLQRDAMVELEVRLRALETIIERKERDR